MHSKPVKILIVDDDEDDFIITGDYIKHIPNTRYVIEWCPRYKDAIVHMTEGNYDLYFVDYRLGAKSGVDLLKEALQNGCEDPIILLTGKGNYEVDIEAMQLGAVDYLVKTELSVEKMERSIRYALDRTATMKALKANERKYRSIFERSKDIVFITDMDLNFKDVNEAVQLLGYDKDEMMQMSLRDIGGKQYIDQLKYILETHKGINDYELILGSKTGERKTCLLSATVEENQAHESYIQGIIHDITNLKKMEKATLQAEKLAATGRLVRTLAHEVRNPLNNITLSVEQMQQDITDETSLLYMNIIQRNSKRISDLINELLNTSRPSEIRLQEESLQNILDSVIASTIDRLTLKRIKLKVSYPDDEVLIFADKEKLELALLNIVINAIEAMEEQKGLLSILFHLTGQYATVQISDNGIGISEENISRLFEPYYTQKRNGMGLGLAFTLNILQAHKAGIDVNSTLGKGTTFVITFPTVHAPEGESIKQSQERSLPM
ncbi:MAG: hybrid sensor histidine kinase/response regulator [Bacteroidetes bacterium 46-16]|nr:MAG: hybrid sensor histidine kinase/response regulator [Bacteroidetes bacterium 46-16]